MAWKQGPLPPETWQWGGVVPVGTKNWGFYFADFHGDHVKIEVLKPVPGGTYMLEERILKPDEVAWYNNDIEMPPGGKGRIGAGQP